MLADVDRFLAQRDYSPATRYSYGYCLHRLALWLDDCGLTVTDLDAAVLVRFLDDHPAWSPNMRRLYIAACRAFTLWRFGAGHPVMTVKVRRVDAAPGRSLDEGLALSLLSGFDTSTPMGWRNLAICSLMIDTGLRASEICNLQLRYVSVQRRQFSALVKGRKWKPGVFSEATARFLDMWLSVRPQIAQRGVPYVFVGILGSTPGHKMTAGGLRSLFRKFGARAGIGALSPHDLRRTMACLLTEAGAPSRLVQLLGRWEDIRMVDLYTQRLKPSQIDRYSPVVALLGGKGEQS